MSPIPSGLEGAGIITRGTLHLRDAPLSSGHRGKATETHWLSLQSHNVPKTTSKQEHVRRKRYSQTRIWSSTWHLKKKKKKSQKSDKTETKNSVGVSQIRIVILVLSLNYATLSNLTALRLSSPWESGLLHYTLYNVQACLRDLISILSQFFYNVHCISKQDHSVGFPQHPISAFI